MQHQHCAQMLEAGPPVHDGAAEQHVYALVGEGEAPPVHLLPTADHTLALLEATSSPLHFWRCNATAGASRPSSQALPCGEHGLACSLGHAGTCWQPSACSAAIWHDNRGAKQYSRP